MTLQSVARILPPAMLAIGVGLLVDASAQQTFGLVLIFTAVLEVLRRVFEWAAEHP